MCWEAWTGTPFGQVAWLEGQATHAGAEEPEGPAASVVEASVVKAPRCLWTQSALSFGCWLLRSLNTSLSVLDLSAPPRPRLRPRGVSGYFLLLRPRMVSVGLGGTGFGLEALQRCSWQSVPIRRHAS